MLLSCDAYILVWLDHLAIKEYNNFKISSASRAARIHIQSNEEIRKYFQINNLVDCRKAADSAFFYKVVIHGTYMTVLNLPV